MQCWVCHGTQQAQVYTMRLVGMGFRMSESDTPKTESKSYVQILKEMGVGRFLDGFMSGFLLLGVLTNIGFLAHLTVYEISYYSQNVPESTHIIYPFWGVLFWSALLYAWNRPEKVESSIESGIIIIKKLLGK